LHRSDKNFASVSLHFASKRNYGSFSLPFRFEAKIMAVFRFHFASFRFEAKMMAAFCFNLLRSENYSSFSLLFCFVFASFHFRFASDFYILHQCETSENALFFASNQLLPDRRGGRPESSLSLRSHGGGTPPPPGPGEGGVTTPYSRSKAGTTGTSLLRGSGGF
jgi:hypothetical protein